MRTQTRIHELEKLLQSKEVILLNSGYEVISITHWHRAIDLVVNNEAQIFLARTNGDLVRSKYMSLPKPLAITMFRYIPAYNPRVSEDCLVSKDTIFKRDNNTCQYCFGKSGEPADTVDHIVPDSQGGLRSWGNLVACCKPCNQEKADKSLKEVGFKMPNIPVIQHINYKITQVQE